MIRLHRYCDYIDTIDIGKGCRDIYCARSFRKKRKQTTMQQNVKLRFVNDDEAVTVTLMLRNINILNISGARVIE